MNYPTHFDNVMRGLASVLEYNQDDAFRKRIQPSLFIMAFKEVYKIQFEPEKWSLQLITYKLQVYLYIICHNSAASNKRILETFN